MIEMIVQQVVKTPATTEGKKPEGKRVEVTPGKGHYGLYIAIMAVLMAVIVIGVVVFMAQTPAKTSQDTSQEVKTPAENAVVNAETGAVVIPADAYETTQYQLASQQKRFSINKFPQNILVKDRDTLFKGITISSSEITLKATRVNSGPDPTVSTLSGLNIYFYKSGENLGGAHIGIPTNKINGDTYTTKRPPETLGADEISFDPQ